MTRYLIFEPEIESIRTVELNYFDEAVAAAGLKWDQIDHSKLNRWTGFAVDEFGMFVPPEQQHYVALYSCQQHYVALYSCLCAGNVLLYGVDERGNTVDVTAGPSFHLFLHGREQVESAISRGIVSRPHVRINGDDIWKWPEPAPFDMRQRTT